MTWQARARCAGDPDAGELLLTRVTPAARRYCAACPVAAACLAAALEEEAGAPVDWRAGVRGGRSPAERARLELGLVAAPVLKVRTSACVTCGATITQAGAGRPRRYCSDPCQWRADYARRRESEIARSRRRRRGTVPLAPTG